MCISSMLYPTYLCFYFVGYKLVFYQWWCMVVSMLFHRNEYIMNLWSNRLHFILWCNGSIILAYSQISTRPLFLYMFFIPIDVMFVTYLNKFLSLLGGVIWIMADVITSICLLYFYLPYPKVTIRFSQWLGLSHRKYGTNPRDMYKNILFWP